MSWKKMKLKYLAHMQSGDSITSESIEVEGIYPVYGGGALRGYTEIYTHDGEHILIGRQGAHCGSVREVKGKFFASEHAVVVTHSKGVDNGWLYYLLESMNLIQYSISAAQPGLSVGSIKNLEVNVPYYDLQVKIRKYIDKKTKMFESIIKQKEKLINLLEQQRQSIITEAVTKGLNPNVKMKDSGVEWIGEIPEHWKLTKIKYVAKLLNGDRGENYPSGNDFVDEGIPFITSHNLNGRYINESNLKYISEERYNLLRGIKVKEKDIIYCLRGSVGKNSLVTKDEGTIASSLMGIRGSTKVNAEFLSYILNSKMEVWNRSMLTTGSVSDNLSAENVGTYLFTFPDLNEQFEIVNYLNTEMLKLEELIMVVNQQIEKLKEYRQSLIYEAVTGKIDVGDMELD